MTPTLMAARGIEVAVLPATSTFADIAARSPDGVFFSNGPGDPATAEHEVGVLREILDARIPFFGICFGNQLLGRTLGFGTYKLRYGHRGINQPVLDRASKSPRTTTVSLSTRPWTWKVRRTMGGCGSPRPPQRDVVEGLEA